MKHYRVIIPILVCLAFLVTTTITGIPADDPDVPQAEDPPSGRASLSTMSEAQAEILSPLKREMREILLRERSDVELLTQRLAGLNDRLAALDLQRAISDRNFKTQIELLEVQGRYARRAGRIQQADEVEAAVVRLKSLLTSPRSDEGGG